MVGEQGFGFGFGTTVGCELLDLEFKGRVFANDFVVRKG
jgi:hypothetical protein